MSVQRLSMMKLQLKMTKITVLILHIYHHCNHCCYVSLQGHKNLISIPCSFRSMHYTPEEVDSSLYRMIWEAFQENSNLAEHDSRNVWKQWRSSFLDMEQPVDPSFWSIEASCEPKKWKFQNMFVVDDLFLVNLFQKHFGACVRQGRHGWMTVWCDR